MSYKTTIIDEPVNIKVKKRTWKRFHTKESNLTKGYGDRRFAAYHTFGGGVYPKADAIFRVGYALYKNKTVKGNYTKIIHDKEGGSSSVLHIYENSIEKHKWSRNKQYVSATGYFDAVYQWIGYDYTKHIKVYNRITPKKWYKKGVFLEQYTTCWRD